MAQAAGSMQIRFGGKAGLRFSLFGFMTGSVAFFRFALAAMLGMRSRCCLLGMSGFALIFRRYRCVTGSSR